MSWYASIKEQVNKHRKSRNGGIINFFKRKFGYRVNEQENAVLDKLIQNIDNIQQGDPKELSPVSAGFMQSRLQEAAESLSGSYKSTKFLQNLIKETEEHQKVLLKNIGNQTYANPYVKPWLPAEKTEAASLLLPTKPIQETPIANLWIKDKRESLKAKNVQRRQIIGYARYGKDQPFRDKWKVSGDKADYPLWQQFVESMTHCIQQKYYARAVVEAKNIIKKVTSDGEEQYIWKEVNLVTLFRDIAIENLKDPYKLEQIEKVFVSVSTIISSSCASKLSYSNKQACEAYKNEVSHLLRKECSIDTSKLTYSKPTCVAG